jgi:hypothetical protein
VGSDIAGDKEAVGHTHRVVDGFVMSKKEQTRRWRLPRSFPHVVPTSFLHATPASFLFGAIWGVVVMWRGTRRQWGVLTTRR